MKKYQKLTVAFLLVCMLFALLTGCNSQSSVPKGQNCIKNGNFASSNKNAADDWHLEAYSPLTGNDGMTIEKGVGPNGENAAKIVVSQANDTKLIQEVACKKNTVYKFTVLCKTENVTKTKDDLGANISTLGVFTKPKAIYGTNDWTTLEFYGKTDSNQTTLEVALRLGFYSNDASGTVWFTNATMTEIDPSAVPSGVTVATLTDLLKQQSQQDDEESTKKAELESTSTTIILGGVIFAVLMVGAYFLLRRMGVAQNNTRLLIMLGIICLGVIARVHFASDYPGFKVDIDCFWSWGATMLEHGPFDFYSSVTFCDYPPLYMMLLAIPSAIIQLLGIKYGSAEGWLMIKLIPIICDVILACFIFRIADKKMPKLSVLLAAAYMFNPAVIVNTASWGQVDSVFMLFVVLAIYYIVKKKLWISVIYYALALLIKPQALLFGPVMLAGAIVLCINAWKGKLGATVKESRKQISYFIYSMLGIFAAFVLLSVIMRGKQDSILWLFEKYFATMGEYKYASLSAFNLMSLLGGQWAKIDKPVIGSLTYGTLGIILLIAVIALFAWLFYVKKKNRNLFLLSSVLIAGIYVLGPYMHERYLFPVLALLLMAYIIHSDKRLLYVFALFSVTSYINVAQVLFLHFEPSNDNGVGYFAADSALLLIGSAINVLIFAYLVYVTVTIVYKGDAADPALIEAPVSKAITIERDRKELVASLASMENAPKKPFLNRKDWIIMLGVTVIYTVITLLNLGSTNTPEHYWDANIGDQVVVDFGAPTTVQRYHLNTSICHGSYTLGSTTYNGGVTIEYSQDGTNWKTLVNHGFNNGDMFKWNRSKSNYDITARYVRVTSKANNIKLNEMIFFSSEDATDPIKIQSATSGQTTLDSDALAAYREHSALALFNEQGTAVTRHTYYTGMIFDEIYHARTAYEMINGWQIYEWTHPPLGKAIMSLGIRMFGMNPFGWRFMGNLMGILMLPAMYCLGKLIFKKTSWATALMMLMALDGMHYIQTRLATIDSYGVFFIILMYLFMYKYYTMSWNHDEFRKTLIPLGLSGISFGLGIACKWIGAYAGVGLAILFFFTIYKRIREYNIAVKSINNPTLSPEQQRKMQFIKDNTMRYVLYTILFCVAFFVVIPLIIYCASYGSYFNAPGNKGAWYKTILDNQERMLNYHNGITSDDNYWQSKWYTWPIMWHPYWYYQAPNLTGDAMGTISCMGNPLIWWFGLISIITSVFLFIKRLVNLNSITDAALKARARKDIHLLGFVLIGLAVNFGAWMLVPRSTFIYHYFATIPFMMVLSVYVLRQAHAYLCRLGNDPVRSRMLANAAVIGFFVLCFGLACMFYPVWSGIDTSKEYVKNWLWWIPSYRSDDNLGQGWHFFNN